MPTNDMPATEKRVSARRALFAFFVILAFIAVGAISWLVMRGLLVEAGIAVFALIMACIVAIRSRRESTGIEALGFEEEDGATRAVEISEPKEAPPALQSLQAGRDDFVVEELSPVLKLTEAAKRLFEEEKKRVLFVSPEGNAGTAASIRYARERADTGGRVVLVDMTFDGAVARPTLEGDVKAGITDLLAGSARYADAIHADLYSDTHIVPLGRVDPARAMQDADRLPIILNALTVAYDVVVIECGASSAEGLHRLASEESSICIAVVRDRKKATDLKRQMVRLGYPKPLLVWAEA